MPSWKKLVTSGSSPTLNKIFVKDKYALELQAGVAGPRIFFGATTDTDSFMSFGSYGSINNLDTETRDFHIFGSNTTTGFYFDESAGKVGIGTTTPTEKLTVEGDISASGNILLKDGGRIGSYDGIERNDDYIRFDDPNRRIDFLIDNDAKLSATIEGVAVGSDTSPAPNMELTVGGDISASGTITANAFVGDGSSITGVTAEWDGTHTGTATFQGSVAITGDGSNAVTLTESGNGDFTIDANDDIRLDANGADVVYKDDSVEFGRLSNDSTDFVIKSSTNNKDIIFRGVDNTAEITALTLDMSEAGSATFNSHITATSGTGSFAHIQLPADGRIQFDDNPGSNDQFIYGKEHQITIDGDNYVNIYSDNYTTFWGGYVHLKNYLTTESHITASGNISASGTIYGTIGTATQGTIDHDSLSGFVAQEHLDWTNNVGTIHAGNYTNTNTMGSGFTVSATTDSNETTITQGDDLMFVAGTGITCETTGDNQVTITVTDALMDSELSSITDVKALDQSVVSGATPTFTTTNFTDASNKRFMTDAQETKLDSVESSADVTDTTNVTSAGALMDSEVTSLALVKGLTAALISGSSTALSSSIATKLGGIESSADVTDTTNVTAAGALMDSELSSITDVKALDQSVVSGATPTFTTTNFTDASNKRLMTDAQETKLDSVESSADVTDATNVTAAGALMDSEVTSLALIKGLTAASISGSCTVRTFTKTTTSVANYNGDVVYFGATESMTAGAIYHYVPGVEETGAWTLADADAEATCDGLLAVALGTLSDSNGMLIKGMVTLDHDPGSLADTLFVSTTAGEATSTAPSGNTDIIRIIGYCLDDETGQIWFDPDKTFVEVTA